MLADDVVWHEPGRSPIAGDHKGPDGVADFLQRLHMLSRGTLSVELVDVMVNAARAVAIQRVTAQVGERSLDVIDALDFEIYGGRITEISVYQQDAYDLRRVLDRGRDRPVRQGDAEQRLIGHGATTRIRILRSSGSNSDSERHEIRRGWRSPS